MLIIAYVVEENVVPEVCLLQCLHGNSTWTLKIFLNQEAIKRKQCFRRPCFILYFLLDLWCRFISCRFLSAYFRFPVYLHTLVYIYAIRLLVSQCFWCFHNILTLHFTSLHFTLQPQFFKNVSSGIQPTFLHGNCIKVCTLDLGVLL